MKTAELIIKQYPNILDPKTNLPFQAVMWPATSHVKQIPVLQNYPDGSMKSMLYWVFDETIASTVIKPQDGCIQLYDKRDLFQFGRWDIHQLSLHQIKVAEDIFEPDAKEYTSMVADIIKKRMQNGAMGRSDVILVDKD